MTQIGGLSACLPALVCGGLSRVYEHIMLYGALKGGNAKVAFALLHNSMAQLDRPRLWNLYGTLYSAYFHL